MYILGLANSHNGAVALIQDGKVRAAIQLERLQRIKRSSLYFEKHEIGPALCEAINYCLSNCGITMKDVDAVGVSTPLNLNRNVFWPHHQLQWVPHHLAHAEYALHYSDLKPGLVMVVDGHGTSESDRNAFDVVEQVSPGAEIFGGEVETISAYMFNGNSLSLIHRNCGDRDETHRVFRGSIGSVWQVGSAICFGSGDEAGKLMGLAAYGGKRLPDRVLRLDDEGRLHTDFNLLANASLAYRDVAHEIQAQTSRVLVELLSRLKAKTGANALYYSGGVALNVVSNERIVRSGLFDKVHLNGSCEDNGTAIGAALAVYLKIKNVRVPERISEYYGTSYMPEQIRCQLTRFPVRFEELNVADLIDLAASKLADGNVVGWFQGGSEFGPRALGNRSILADPRDRSMKDRLNGRVKRREGFRPYAASVDENCASNYFDLEGSSPVMLREAHVKDSELPAVTHVDGTSRIQTVSPADNPRFHALIRRFGNVTGRYVILNTSMNVLGEPIAEVPEDAILVFLRTEIDCLFIGDFFVTRL